ncbi:hypothetical protein BDV93DRAFT_186301 [Ceratobasidium sp. AG-I]|nr:hypothetical protein BDV93DRAFT_186301 [Ceratobasidium sp. AG-I]
MRVRRRGLARLPPLMGPPVLHKPWPSSSHGWSLRRRLLLSLTFVESLRRGTIRLLFSSGGHCSVLASFRSNQSSNQLPAYIEAAVGSSALTPRLPCAPWSVAPPRPSPGQLANNNRCQLACFDSRLAYLLEMDGLIWRDG